MTARRKVEDEGSLPCRRPSFYSQPTCIKIAIEPTNSAEPPEKYLDLGHLGLHPTRGRFIFGYHGAVNHLCNNTMPPIQNAEVLVGDL